MRAEGGELGGFRMAQVVVHAVGLVGQLVAAALLWRQARHLSTWHITSPEDDISELKLMNGLWRHCNVADALGPLLFLVSRLLPPPP